MSDEHEFFNVHIWNMYAFDIDAYGGEMNDGRRILRKMRDA